jgi:hypothetical protein
MWPKLHFDAHISGTSVLKNLKFANKTAHFGYRNRPHSRFVAPDIPYTRDFCNERRTESLFPNPKSKIAFSIGSVENGRE